MNGTGKKYYRSFYAPGEIVEFVGKEFLEMLADRQHRPPDGSWWCRGEYVSSAPEVGRSFHRVKIRNETIAVVPAKNLRPVKRKVTRKQAPTIIGSSEERFWAKVNKDGPPHPYDESFGTCWVWTAGCMTRGGYGQFNHTRPGGMPEGAHRVALRFSGVVGEFEACHGCDNPKCVRVAPGHVRAGTHLSNMAEMAARLRSGRQKLSVNQVREIRDRLENGDRVIDIASDFEVSRGTVTFIRAGTIWKHVFDEKVHVGGYMSEIPKAPDGDFLTAEQILELGRGKGGPVEYAPEGEYACKYCGVQTKQRPYKKDGYSWPACCSKCMDVWEPLPKEEPTP